MDWRTARMERVNIQRSENTTCSVIASLASRYVHAEQVSWHSVAFCVCRIFRVSILRCLLLDNRRRTSARWSFCRDLWRAYSVTCSADDESTGYLQGIYVLLKSSGTVVWPIPIRLRTSCKVDITYFPFDDQLCTLLFGSSVYSHWRVAFNVSLKNFLDILVCVRSCGRPSADEHITERTDDFWWRPAAKLSIIL